MASPACLSLSMFKFPCNAACNTVLVLSASSLMIMFAKSVHGVNGLEYTPQPLITKSPGQYLAKPMCSYMRRASNALNMLWSLPAPHLCMLMDMLSHGGYRLCIDPTRCPRFRHDNTIYGNLVAVVMWKKLGADCNAGIGG